VISTSHHVKPRGGETCTALFLRFWATAIHGPDADATKPARRRSQR
jgi:hypothetical protein